MKVELCDICKEQRPNREYKIKMRRRGRLVSGGASLMWDPTIWNSWERLSVCEKCARKLLGEPPEQTTEEWLKEIQEDPRFKH